MIFFKYFLPHCLKSRNQHKFSKICDNHYKFQLSNILENIYYPEQLHKDNKN